MMISVEGVSQELADVSQVGQGTGSNQRMGIKSIAQHCSQETVSSEAAAPHTLWSLSPEPLLPSVAAQLTLPFFPLPQKQFPFSWLIPQFLSPLCSSSEVAVTH